MTTPLRNCMSVDQAIIQWQPPTSMGQRPEDTKVALPQCHIPEDCTMGTYKAHGASQESACLEPQTDRAWCHA